MKKSRKKSWLTKSLVSITALAMLGVFHVAAEDNPHIDGDNEADWGEPNGVRDDRIVYFPTTEELGTDEMRIISCGTGMPTARESQAAACFLVELGNGDKFIFDLGTGSHARLASLDIPYDYLNKVFISHLHADHFGDFAAMYIGGWVGGRMVPFKVWGPSGKDVISEVAEPWNQDCDPENPVDPYDPTANDCDYLYGTRYSLEKWRQALTWDLASRAGTFPPLGGELEITEFPYDEGYYNGDIAEFPIKPTEVYNHDGVIISAWPAVHAIDGPVSYSLTWNDYKFVFSGDTFPNEWFTKYAKNADVVIHECFLTVDQLVEKYGFTEEQAQSVGTQVHTSPQAFGYVMSLVKPKLAIAYHFFNDFDTAGDIYDLVRLTYPKVDEDGNEQRLSMADDFMVWNLSRDGNGDTVFETRLIVYDPDVWPPEASEYSVPPEDAVSFEKSPWLIDGKESPPEPPIEPVDGE